MQDSNIVVFHGPRGGGKTGSMVVQAVIDMILGRQVWSLLPITAYFEGELYQSLPIDYTQLLRQDERLQDGVVCWDETALWAYSQNWQAYFSKILGLVLTLIRKMDLSLYMTVQFESLLSKNIRLQMDALVMCTDLSYKYPHLQRGSTIGQLLQDISGRFTGATFEYSQEMYQRSLYLKPFWKCFDTKALPNIEETQRKITKDELYGVYEEESQYQYTEDDKDQLIINLLVGELRATHPNISRGEFWQMARGRGFGASLSKGGIYLSELGVGRGKTTYHLDSAGTQEGVYV